MKSSLIASGLMAVALWQGPAHAQVFDLPEPGGGVPVAKEPVTLPFAEKDSKYAGSLRLGPISRKENGTQFRVVLAEPARLVRLDLRASFGKSQVREAWLVTESGNRIEVQKYRGTGVLETSSLNSSENFSLNENIVEILISAEGFSDDAELFLTAVNESFVPRLSHWHPPMSNTPNYTPFPSMGSSATLLGRECIEDFCVGDVVIFMRQRAKIVQIYSDGRIVLLQRGVRKTLANTSKFLKPSTPPYR